MPKPETCVSGPLCPMPQRDELQKQVAATAKKASAVVDKMLQARPGCAGSPATLHLELCNNHLQVKPGSGKSDLNTPLFVPPWRSMA